MFYISAIYVPFEHRSLIRFPAHPDILAQNGFVRLRWGLLYHLSLTAASFLVAFGVTAVVCTNNPKGFWSLWGRCRTARNLYIWSFSQIVVSSHGSENNRMCWRYSTAIWKGINCPMSTWLSLYNNWMYIVLTSMQWGSWQRRIYLQ